VRPRSRLAGLVALGGALVATHASLAPAATTAHSRTIVVACSETGFTADANAFAGQRREVTAFYGATGIACRIFDGETRALLYDPSA
jgi:hypothetical protein